MHEFFCQSGGYFWGWGVAWCAFVEGITVWGPKDEFFCGGARSLAEQEGRYRHMQNRKGLVWSGLNRGDKFEAEEARTYTSILWPHPPNL